MCRQSRNAAQALSAGEHSWITFHVTAGPNASVIGESTMLGPGIEVAQVMLNPSGTNIAWVTNGLRPCRSACGHHAKNHMNWLESIGSDATIRLPRCPITGTPHSS